MLLIAAIQALAGLYVFHASVMALNRMDSRTSHAMRLAHVALAAGSAAMVVSCFVARDIFECLSAVGIALYVAGNRRERMGDNPMSPNLKAFLDTIAWSEIGPELLARTNNGYDVCVGSTPSHPIRFTDYSTHPRRHDVATDSDAAGRYQEMGKYWEDYRAMLQLPDFGPASQDKWAIQLIRECHALDDVEAGRLDQAIVKCRSRWASLPGAGYGQRENRLADLRAVFVSAGGVLA